MSSIVNCLLLVDQRTIPDKMQEVKRKKLPKMKIYALVPRGHYSAQLCETFTQSGITVLRNSDFDTSLVEGIKTDNIQLLEIKVKEDSIANSKRLLVYVEEFLPEYNDIVSAALNGHEIVTCGWPPWSNSELDEENLNLIIQLVSHGTGIKCRNPAGGTFLHYAVLYKNEPLVRLLLTSGACVDARTPEGETPLHIAAMFGNYIPVSICKLLIEYGADPNALDKRGCTPLQTLVSKDSLERINFDLFNFLLDNGASVDADSPLGSLLEEALRTDFATFYPYDLLPPILNRHPDLNDSKNQKAYRFAIHYHLGKAPVRILEDYGFRLRPLDARDPELLSSAIRKGDPNLINILLKWGAHVSCMKNGDIIGGFKQVEGFCYLKSHKRFKFLLELDELPSRISFILSNRLYAFLKEILSASDLNLCSLLDKENYYLHGVYECKSVIAEHVNAVRAADLTCNKDFEALQLSKNEYDFLSSAFFLPPSEDCVAQATAMRNQFIGDSDVSYHDLLNTAIPKIVKQLKNRSMVEALKTKDYKNKFPSYASKIGWRFRKANRRRTLLDEGLKMFNFLFKTCPKLPLKLQENILERLTNLDLLVFVSIGELDAAEFRVTN